MIDEADEVFAFWRTLDEQTVLFLFNFTSRRWVQDPEE